MRTSAYQAARRRHRRAGTRSSARLGRLLLATAALWLAFAGMAAAQTYATDTGSLTIGGDATPGGEVSIQETGFQAGSDVQIVLVDGGAEAVLTTVTADDEGAVNTTVSLPNDFSGDGSLEARGMGPDGASLVLSSPISSNSTQSTSGSLARTGGSTTPWLVGGAITAGVGVLLIALARQRRSATAAAG
jgi:hypothetical protein